MAKDNCGTKFKLIHLILVLLCLFGSCIAAWVWQQAETKALGKETATLGKEGCGPAKAHETQLVLMEFRLDSIDKKQDELCVKQEEMRKESGASFKEILKRLPK